MCLQTWHFHRKYFCIYLNSEGSWTVKLDIYQSNDQIIQFIDVVTPENSKCVQCDGTGYLYLEETGQCQDPEGQFVDKR